ncbi:glycosyltransferase family 1 protein [Acinetobacter sp.]|uniref:glycosyltransferase family 1 protein n=1 Tax=Acinetobacter sp. TaxID=472 RepID=UPI0028A5FE15|nr:glycosyltransferase family 1 protein [Acinetobacter sp.]
MNKIYFIGTLPQPTGGVTIYNKRKVGILSNEYQVVVIQPKINTLLSIAKIFTFSNALVYISTFNFIVILLATILNLKNFYFIDHNTSRHINSFGFFKKIICLSFFKRAKKIILVSDHLLENYKRFSFFKDMKFQIEQAFIPPNISEKKCIIAKYYPDELKKILGTRKIILASASKTNLDICGKDIYTLRETLNTYDILAEKYTNYLFVMAIAEFSNDEFGLEIKNMCEVLSKKYKNFILLKNNTPIWPLFESTSLFLRITTTDGDSVSLKEALFFECPVLATDVVVRPDGTNLFNLNRDNLVTAVSNFLSGK